jgi:hypothetical protein
LQESRPRGRVGSGDSLLEEILFSSDVSCLEASQFAGGEINRATWLNSHAIRWALGDFDYNGFVDDDDVTLLGAFYDPSAASLVVPSADAATATAAVPEPASVTLVLLAGAVAAIAARRSCRMR